MKIYPLTKEFSMCNLKLLTIKNDSLVYKKFSNAAQHEKINLNQSNFHLLNQ